MTNTCEKGYAESDNCGSLTCPRCSKVEVFPFSEQEFSFRVVALDDGSQWVSNGITGFRPDVTMALIEASADIERLLSFCFIGPDARPCGTCATCRFRAALREVQA